MSDKSLPPISAPIPPAKMAVPPASGEVITSLATGNTYTMGNLIGEGYFGLVFSCVDFWGNDLAAKVLKPVDTYDHVRASAEAELRKLVVLRHPNITYIFDAFEYRRHILHHQNVATVPLPSSSRSKTNG